MMRSLGCCCLLICVDNVIGDIMLNVIAYGYFIRLFFNYALKSFLNNVDRRKKNFSDFHKLLICEFLLRRMGYGLN